ncbi:MAG: ABC transporter ATP-binding protein, partial [Thermostichus sp. BF3_bins_97]
QTGTLAQLRADLGLERLELRTPELERAEQVLNATIEQGSPEPGEHGSRRIADVQSFGDRLDVLVKEARQDEMGQILANEELVHRLLSQAGIPVQELVRAEATLENIFVTRLRQQGSLGNAAEGPARSALPTDVAFPRTRVSHPQGSAIKSVGLTKTFGTFTAVRDIDLDIRYGEIYGLLGANGAGKTTTIKMLCGLLSPSSGQMILGGEQGNLRSAALRRRIGYMSQKFTLYDDLTIQENLEFYCGVYGVPRPQRPDKIAWVLETCGLQGQEHLLTGRLPGGWKQRVAFGASVMHEPEILFLDEPTSGVDPLARRQFWRLIREFAHHGTAILVTTHYLEEAENCHRMGFMAAGAMVAQGSPSQIKGQQPGQLLELHVSDPQRAVPLLKGHLSQVSIFGDRLHVAVEEWQIPHISGWLSSAGIQMYSQRRIPFSLEDAFISIVLRSSTGSE